MTKFFKILFFLMTLISSLISVSAYSWTSMWMGLEMNLLSIIPLMIQKKNSLTAEASMKYFIVQAIASTVILLSIIMLMAKSSLSSMMINKTHSIFLSSALLMKMGMAPFHFWFPEVLEGLSWMNCMIILTWQKLAPMVILIYNPSNIKFMSMVIIISVTISGLMAFNQMSLRKILAYSSINHMSWMVSMIISMQTIWFYYFLIYSMITINMIALFSKLKCIFFNQFMNINKNNINKMFFSMNFLSLGGIPPFLGFIPKWISIQNLIDNKMIMLPVIMVISTLIMIFTYIRMILTSLTLNSSETKWKMNWEWLNISSFLTTMNFWMTMSAIMITISIFF